MNLTVKTSFHQLLQGCRLTADLKTFFFSLIIFLLYNTVFSFEVNQDEKVTLTFP